MRARWIEQTVLTAFLLAACVTLSFAVLAAHSQNAGPLRPDLPAFSGHRHA